MMIKEWKYGIYSEVESRLNLRIVCYLSVQNLVSTHPLPESLRINFARWTLGLPVCKNNIY